jgi:hypothetical protein
VTCRDGRSIEADAVKVQNMKFAKIQSPVRPGFRSTAVGVQLAVLGMSVAAVFVVGASFASAEILPLPKNDYEATAKIGKEPAVIRYHAGILRVEQKDVEIVTLIDFRRSIATVLGTRDGTKIAMEVPAAIFFYLPTGSERVGRLVGSATAAGETCDVWRHIDVNPYPYKGAKKQLESDTCIASDGAWLRTVERDPDDVILDVVEIKRQLQDPGLFVVPADYQLLPFVPPR